MTRPDPSAPRTGRVDHESLRQVFAEEVSSRLPSMTVAAAAVGAEGDVECARELARHTHTLASGAVVVGEDLAAQHAHACELALEPYLDGEVSVVPPQAVREALDQLATLSILLAPWLTGGDGDGA